ncbi:MAG: tRNA lysidine(34) synthetase TilS, partial [Saprospiraceae bacterium]
FVELISDTKQYAELNKLNTQSAARNIRYDWWENLRANERFEYVATAHHRDDSIETFFLNLLRGTGIKGLRGIPAKRDYFIRPLIDVSKAAIEAFASDYQIPYRSDQSNETDDYQRNRIRHHLIPILREMNPHFNSAMSNGKERIEMEWEAWQGAWVQWQTKNVIAGEDGVHIKTETSDRAFLLRWLEEKGIPWSLAHDFISSPKTNGSKELVHGEYRLSRSKTGFYFTTITADESILIHAPGNFQIGHHELSIKKIPFSSVTMNTDPTVEYVDLGKVEWPLVVTGIKPGDHLQPMGMHGKGKKIQDFLVDLRMALHEKNKVRILRSNNQIIWIMGKRLDERVKVTGESNEIYELRYK